MTIFNLPGSVTSFTCFGYSKNPAIISHLLITKNISNYNLIMKVSHTYSGLSGFCIICQAAAPVIFYTKWSLQRWSWRPCDNGWFHLQLTSKSAIKSSSINKKILVFEDGRFVFGELRNPGEFRDFLLSPLSVIGFHSSWTEIWTPKTFYEKFSYSVLCSRLECQPPGHCTRFL